VEINDYSVINSSPDKMYCIAVHFHLCVAQLNSDQMSAEYQQNLSSVSQIPAEFLKLREFLANPDIS